MNTLLKNDIDGLTFYDTMLSSKDQSTSKVVSAFNELISSDNFKLPLSGGEVSGSLSILSGGISLRDDSSKVKNFDFQGGYVEGSVGKYTKEKNKTGSDDYIIRDGNQKADPSKLTKYWFEPMCAGAKCYCILSAWNNEDGYGMLKLSGDINGILQVLEINDSKHARWSLALFNLNLPGMYTIVDVSGECVILDSTIDLVAAGIQDAAGNLINGFDRGEERYIEIWENGLVDEDDNSFYCATWPEVGNQVSPFMKYAHAEGNACRAVQRFDHAEGRKNIVDGRYAHVEGDGNIAYGWNNHTEGYSNRVHNATGNHVEGSQHVINAGQTSHVEGQYNQTSDSADRVIKTQATHIEGGHNNVSNTKFSHIEGSSHTVRGGNNLYVGGEGNTVTDVKNASVFGRANVVKDCPNVYGHGSIDGLALSVEGCNYFNAAGAYSTLLSSDYTEVHGMCVSIAKQNTSFIWSGKSVSREEDKYGYAEDDDGNRIAKFPAGSFCLNPTNGLCQFFIGNQSLSGIIDDAISTSLDKNLNISNKQLSAALLSAVNLGIKAAKLGLDSISSLEVELPNPEPTPEPEPIDYSQQPFCIEALEAGNVTLQLSYGISQNIPESLSLIYSLDNENWSDFTIAKSIELGYKAKLYLKARSQNTALATVNAGLKFSSTCKFNVSGNIMSLLYNDFKDKKEIVSKYCFVKLFESASVVDASNLILPATTLGHMCYKEMFNNCTYLTSAPALPATTLVDSCYYSMFSGCKSLAVAPALPATQLFGDSYNKMFSGCTSLRTAPEELPATQLTEYCYANMFSGCTSLTSAPELPATTLAANCYYAMFNGCTSLTSAPELPATTLAANCYYDMFNGCTSLSSAPALPATQLTEDCYGYMFSYCTSLRYAPNLLATTLANGCYSNMFSGCTSLTSAPALPATQLADSCYNSMFFDCTSLANAPALPATQLAERCYAAMFAKCTSLTSAPALPATQLANDCYCWMFTNCLQVQELHFPASVQNDSTFTSMNGLPTFGADNATAYFDL